MEERIIIAGFGGQGVVLAGNILAESAVAEGKNVSAMVSYGVEMRGGTANCTVIIQDGEIASPVVDHPTTAIILNQQSLDKFEGAVETKGLIVINSSMIERDIARKDVNILKIPATEAASELGNTRVANMVLLGAFIKKTKILNLDKLIKNLSNIFPKQDLIEINKKALEKGAKLCT